MSVASTVKGFVTGTYTVSRADGAGSSANGVYTPPADTEFDVDAGVYPAQGSDLEVLAPGDHGAEVRQVFTVTELKLRDRIEIDDESWEIKSVSEYPSYYRALAARQETP